LGEWIRLDDWGYPIIRREAIPPELMTQARWAVANCPALALKLRKQKA
jgi:ferredoxin